MNKEVEKTILERVETILDMYGVNKNVKYITRDIIKLYEVYCDEESDSLWVLVGRGTFKKIK